MIRRSPLKRGPKGQSLKANLSGKRTDGIVVIHCAVLLCLGVALGNFHFLFWEAERSYQRLLRLLKEKVSDLCFREITLVQSLSRKNTRKREVRSPGGR